jgi:RNA polymerase sigma factor (sigma-70 family)
MDNKDLEKYIFQIAQGKKDSLRRIYEDFSHVVFMLAFSILGKKETAEDVMQEVFIKIWRYASTYHKGNNPKAWIMSITRNTAVDFKRKRKHEFLTDLSALCDSEDTDLTLGSDEKLEMQQALAMLDGQERQIIIDLPPKVVQIES